MTKEKFVDRTRIEFQEYKPNRGHRQLQPLESPLLQMLYF